MHPDVWADIMNLLIMCHPSPVTLARKAFQPCLAHCSVHADCCPATAQGPQHPWSCTPAWTVRGRAAQALADCHPCRQLHAAQLDCLFCRAVHAHAEGAFQCCSCKHHSKLCITCGQCRPTTAINSSLLVPEQLAQPVLLCSNRHVLFNVS